MFLDGGCTGNVVADVLRYRRLPELQRQWRAPSHRRCLAAAAAGDDDDDDERRGP